MFYFYLLKMVEFIEISIEIEVEVEFVFVVVCWLAYLLLTV